ncbi:hypothetical protein [Allosalinactinospora lopnorensis]|uniref:hypothetical protein n=1 Tax=Allosalinactinospora lopnorensis TaxID=1352348 RepID=UPI000695EC0A|nr:hypothetical protein [Allosalinactinospora lopnorensis]
MGTLSSIRGSFTATPAEAIGRLHSYLTAAGMRRLYAADRTTIALLSVREGLTVWCMHGRFQWRDEDGRQITHPAADPEGAARWITGQDNRRTLNAAA